MIYNKFLLTPGDWVIACRTDGTRVLLSPFMSGVLAYSPNTTESPTPPIALPGQEVYIPRLGKTEVIGVWWTSMGVRRYCYRTRGEFNYFDNEMVVICT